MLLNSLLLAVKKRLNIVNSFLANTGVLSMIKPIVSKDPKMLQEAAFDKFLYQIHNQNQKLYKSFFPKVLLIVVKKYLKSLNIKGYNFICNQL